VYAAAACADAPDDIAHVVGDQQGAVAIKDHADGTAAGIAVDADEATEDLDRRTGRHPLSGCAWD
jgi:hypothetical protein